jgi:hypothetical protein
MAVRGAAILEGVGGDILNPRPGGVGEYERMLRALHDVIEAHDPSDDHSNDAMYVHDSYRHLDGVVWDADQKAFADLLTLSWPRQDYNARGGVFTRADILGSNPFYEITLDINKGKALLVDHEKGVRRRVGQNALLEMTRGIESTDSGNRPSDHFLSTGYVIVPEITPINIRNGSGEVTGDSVRRALNPYEEKIASIATNLAFEAAQSTVIKQTNRKPGHKVKQPNAVILTSGRARIRIPDLDTPPTNES